MSPIRSHSAKLLRTPNRRNLRRTRQLPTTIVCRMDERTVRRNSGAGILSSAVPFELLVRMARLFWRQLWHLMMSQLAPTRKGTGSYERPPPSYLSSGYKDQIWTGSFEEDQFLLFYGIECPWCHRCLLAAAFHRLTDNSNASRIIVPVRVYPSPEGKWVLRPVGSRSNAEDANERLPATYRSARDLKQIYRNADPSFRGRATAPLLVDARSGLIVSNESADIVRFMRHIATERQTPSGIDPFPAEYQSQIEADKTWIHDNLNNGVYKVGFARTQAAYEDAERSVFQTLAELEQRLAGQRYVSGTPYPSESDIFLFPTLIRFDSVYHTLFRCCQRKITEFPNLHAWMRDMIQTYAAEVSHTFDVKETANSYFKSLFPLNPSGIVPKYDLGRLDVPHQREQLGAKPDSLQRP